MAQESPVEILDSQSVSSSSNDHSQSSSSDPSLSKNLSFSRLNAKAPEFVPNRPPSPHSNHHQQQLHPPRFVVPPPPPPPAPIIHQVYSPHHPPPVTPFHVPIQSHVIPVQHHQIHHVPVQNFHHRNHHYNHTHHNHHHHHHHGYHHSSNSNHHPRNSHDDHEQDVEPTVKDQKDHRGLSDESIQKVLNQVEYYFSDLNLATTDHLMRFINKDSEGYVPISVVASFKKIKALINGNSQLASILRNSSKLVVSEDGKKVKRQQPLTESDIEELQSRIVIAENLPEDHCHQNLMKIFSTVGSVKNIRTCLPQSSGGGASSASRPTKGESMAFGNKLHAFVEYETIELAEKAIVELNDEGNWRSGLRVRLMFKRPSKPTRARGRKGHHEGELHHEEEDASTSEQQQLNEKQSEDTSPQHDIHSHEQHVGEEHGNEKEGGQRRGRNRGRNKGRGRGDRGQHHHNNNNRGNHHIGTPPSNNVLGNDQPTLSKQPPGPRMPDGTRGFAMGRGKPIAVNIT